MSHYQGFLLNNGGDIWTRSYSENGSKTEMQLREGTPECATHIIGHPHSTSRFWVAYQNREASNEEVYEAYTKAQLHKTGNKND